MLLRNALVPAFCLASLAAGCLGGSAQAVPRATPSAVPIASPAKPPQPPIALVHINHEQFDRFVRMRVTLPWKPVPLKPVFERLPPTFRAKAEEAIRLARDVESANNKREDAARSLHACQVAGEEDPTAKPCAEVKRAALERSLARADDQSGTSLRRAEKRLNVLIKAFERALEDAPTQTADVALALGRLQELADQLSSLGGVREQLDDVLAGKSRAGSVTYGSVFGRSRERSTQEWSAFRRAVQLAPLSSPRGVEARWGLAKACWNAGRAADLVPILSELAASGPEDQRAEAGLRLSLVYADGASADPTLAADALEKALRATPAAPLTTADLWRALGFVRYHAGDFSGALSALDQSFAPRTEPSLRDALSPYSRQAVVELDALGDERLGADCLERLRWEEVSHKLSAPVRALLLSRLAVRTLYRGNSALAARMAAEALRSAPGAPETALATDVLASLARSRGDAAEAQRLEESKKSLAPNPRFHPWAGLGVLGLLSAEPTVEEEERQEALAAAPASASPDNQKPRSPSDRLVSSVARLCAEPVAWRLPAKPGGSLTIDITVLAYPDGRHEALLTSEASDPLGLGPCLRETLPAALSQSGPSVHAVLDFGGITRRKPLEGVMRQSSFELLRGSGSPTRSAKPTRPSASSTP